jgi:hypothetical protein
MSRSDLLHFYTTAIRPVLEYACPAWHTSLTASQTRQIEQIQRRALLIIYGVNDYHELCLSSALPSLYDRRESLCKDFFKSMIDANNCLHYLLPVPRNVDILNKLRSVRLLLAPAAKTDRFQNSFIPYALNNYQ